MLLSNPLAYSLSIGVPMVQQVKHNVGHQTEGESISVSKGWANSLMQQQQVQLHAGRTSLKSKYKCNRQTQTASRRSLFMNSYSRHRCRANHRTPYRPFRIKPPLLPNIRRDKGRLSPETEQHPELLAATMKSQPFPACSRYAAPCVCATLPWTQPRTLEAQTGQLYFTALVLQNLDRMLHLTGGLQPVIMNGRGIFFLSLYCVRLHTHTVGFIYLVVISH